MKFVENAVKPIICFVVVIFSFIFLFVFPVRATICQSMILPAYFYPSPNTQWLQAINSYPATSRIIMTPDSGPGVFVDSNYQAVITAGQAKGVKMLGYVHTKYSGPDIMLIKKHRQ